VGLTAGLAVATPLWLGGYTAWQDGGHRETLRPLTPLSTIPTHQKAAANFIKAQVGSTERVVIDEAADYSDLQVAFFSGLPEQRLIRRRWDNFQRLLAEQPPPSWLVTLKGGTLETKDGVPVGVMSLRWHDNAYKRVAEYPPQVVVYRLTPQPPLPPGEVDPLQPQAPRLQEASGGSG